jgi:hypothetical protein
VSVFIIVGVVGLLLLLVSLFLGDVLDGALDFLDLDTGGFLSGPAIGAFLAAFGFGAAVISYNSDWGTGASALGGVGVGFVIGGVVGMATRGLMRMPTDAPLRAADLVGANGTVVTRIPETGFGEITLVHAGQFMKLSARADGSLREGTPVIVTSVLSSTSVVVMPTVDQ